LGLIRHCSHCLAGLIAAFCRNQPCTSLFALRASSVRFAGLAPALDPAAHPLELRKKQAYESVGHARRSIGDYINLYNQRRPHSSLEDRTPDEAYFATLPAIKLAA
jgi:transposase InsO family protein